MNPDHGNMQRDPKDEWPKDEPVGSFDIYAPPGHGVQGYPGATGHIMFVCPNGHRCSVLVGPQHVDRPEKGKLCIWGWDGNLERPTLTPSIDCRATDEEGKPTGGCGWHGHIINGVMR